MHLIAFVHDSSQSGFPNFVFSSIWQFLCIYVLLFYVISVESGEGDYLLWKERIQTTNVSLPQREGNTLWKHYGVIMEYILETSCLEIGE